MLAAIGILLFVYKAETKNTDKETYQTIQPKIGTIKKTITTTGTVNPQNRLEIKPPIAGRIEEILVSEGAFVHTGDILALMSSTDRAALLDAAMLKGTEEQAYWQEVYNTTPLIAPIDGTVIVRSVEPGQTITTTDAVIVLSDRLIIEADFDETDIGEIKIGQKAVISLDAYENVTIKATVDHIAYESELINNVNIYSVDIVPENVPDVFRSGMSANVEVITTEKQEVLTLPIEAVNERGGQNYVLIEDAISKEAIEVSILVGIQDEENYEIISGLSQKNTVIAPTSKSFTLKKSNAGANPFMQMPGKGKH